MWKPCTLNVEIVEDFLREGYLVADKPLSVEMVADLLDALVCEDGEEWERI